MWRNQVFFDRVGVDTIIDFGQVSANIPTQLFLFFIFPALKFFDEVKLEPGGNL